MKQELLHAGWVAELALQLVGKRPKESVIRVFDVGCGDGLTTVAMIEASPQVFVGSQMPAEAVPLVYELLNRYVEKNRCCPAPMNIVEFIPSTIDDAYDVIVAIFSLNHLKAEDRAFVVGELWRVLKPGAVFIIDGSNDVGNELYEHGFVDITQHSRENLEPILSARKPS